MREERPKNYTGLIIIGFFVLVLGVLLPTIIGWLYSIGVNSNLVLSRGFERTDILNYATTFSGVFATFILGIMTYSMQKQLNHLEKTRDEYTYTPRVTCTDQDQIINVSFDNDSKIITPQTISNKLIQNPAINYNHLHQSISFDLKLRSLSEIYPEKVCVEFFELFINEHDRYQFYNVEKLTYHPVPSGANNDLYIIIFLYVDDKDDLPNKLFVCKNFRIDCAIELKTYEHFHAKYRWQQSFSKKTGKTPCCRMNTSWTNEYQASYGILSRIHGINRNPIQ
jgi:hypothetical protein